MKANFAITLGAAAFPAAAASAILTKRIIGAENPSDRYKFTVSIQDSQKHHLCGGMLLDSTTVLTAAHCFSNETAEGFVVAGKMDLTEAEGVTVKISTIQQPPEKLNFNPTESTVKAGDIGILKLATPIEKSDKIEYAVLPTSDADPKAESVVVAVGWGHTAELQVGESAIAADKRGEATIPLQTKETCSKLKKNLGDLNTLLCAGAPGKNVCKGDSGGPLIDSQTGVLIGLTSLSLPDGAVNSRCEFHSVFTKVGSYLDFINNNLGQRGFTGGENQRLKDEARLAETKSVLLGSCAKNYNQKSFECRQEVDKKYSAVDGEVAEEQLDAYEEETDKCWSIRAAVTACPKCVADTTLDSTLEQVLQCAEGRKK